MSENIANVMSTPRPERQNVALSGTDIESNAVLPIDETQRNQNGKFFLTCL